jgi:hypothetical protein
MRNLWVQVEEPFVVWTARLGAIVSQPERIRSIVDAIVQAGSTHQVFRPEAAPVVGFDRSRDGDMGSFLAQQWERTAVVDACFFTGAAMDPDHPRSSRVCARMATFDRTDAVEETDTADLGRVLRALEPVPGSISDGFTRPFPPVRITGPRLSYEKRQGVLSLASNPADPAILIALHSDIWFPFVFGSSHPSADYKRMFDNRVLAEIHTPRLNAFIRAVTSAVVDAGAEWGIDQAGKNSARWLDASGIHVDANPPDLMPPEALDEEWY